MPLNRHNQSDFGSAKFQYVENSTLFYTASDTTAEQSNLTHPTIELIKSDPLCVAIPLTILYAFILIAGITGNLITCLVILKNKYLQTATNYYLFSLAISDLLLLTFGLPQEIYYIWSRYPYIFGETFCVLRGLMAETSTNASVLTITAFTVERYVAICHPFYAHTVSKLSRAVKAVLTIWIVALVCAIPQALQFGLVDHGGADFIQCTMTRILIPHSFEISSLVFFIVPMVVITILYIRIGIKLKSSAKLKPRRVSKPMINLDSQQSSSQRLIVGGQSSRKILKMLVAVVITFFVCWAPFHAQRLVATYGMTTADVPGSRLMNQIYDVVTYISAILYYTSSTVNPILYHTMSHKFRDAFRETIGVFFGYQIKHTEECRLERRRSSQIVHYHTCRSKRAGSDDSNGGGCTRSQRKIPTCKEVNETTKSPTGKGQLSPLPNDLIVDYSDTNDTRTRIVQLLNCTGDNKNVTDKNKKLLVWCKNKTIVTNTYIV